MSDNATLLLLEQLTSGQDNLNKKFERFIEVEGGRVEREMAQNIKNEEYDEFIKLNREPLNRVRRIQGHIDKAIGGVWSKAILGIALIAWSVALITWAGISWFNWLG